MGWAKHLDGKLTHGTVVFPKDLGDRLVEFRKWLEKNLTVGHVIYEQPFGMPGKAVLTLHAMIGVLLCVCREGDVNAVPISPMTIKKMATGHGHATKTQMLESIRERWPDVDTHDEADALGIFLWYSEEK